MDLSPDDDDSYLSKKGNSSEVIQLSNKCFHLFLDYSASSCSRVKKVLN